MYSSVLVSILNRLEKGAIKGLVEDFTAYITKFQIENDSLTQEILSLKSKNLILDSEIQLLKSSNADLLLENRNYNNKL